MQSGGWLIMIMILTSFFAAFTLYRFNNHSYLTYFGGEEYIFYRKVRMMVIAAFSLALVMMTMVIPELSSGTLAIQMAGLTLAIIQIACMVKAYFELKQYESLGLIQIDPDNVWNFIYMLYRGLIHCERRSFEQARRYVKEHPKELFLAVCQKLINIVTIWGILYCCFVVEIIECYDANTNSTFTCGVGLTDVNVHGYLDTLRPEIRFLGVVYFSVTVGAYITYYAFYKVTLCALDLSNRRASELGRINRKHRSIIKMKENDIKLMSSSWKLKSEDVTLDEKIGGGSFGTVWKARLFQTWRVAVKIVKSETSSSGKNLMVKNNSKEIRTLMRSRHPRLVMFFGFGTVLGTDGKRSTMIVMEYLSGHDLSKRLWRHGQMNFKAPSWEQRIRWLEDVAEALSYLHYILKAVHRDVKSPNILLTDDSDESRAKLCDFGLTKIVARGKRRYNQESPHRNSMTKRSVRRSLWDAPMSNAKGTYQWMAPELLACKSKYGPSIDVYSFGVLMWEALALEMPYLGIPSSEIVDKVSNKNERPYVNESLAKSAPIAYVELMFLCWDQNAKRRPPIGQVLEVLKHDVIACDTPSTKSDVAIDLNNHPSSLVRQSTASDILRERRLSIISQRDRRSSLLSLGTRSRDASSADMFDENSDDDGMDEEKKQEQQLSTNRSCRISFDIGSTSSNISDIATSIKE